jgi:sugar lactone lactonase YvrE
MIRLSCIPSAPVLSAAMLSLAGCGGPAVPVSSLPATNAGIEQSALLAEKPHKRNPCLKRQCIYVGNVGSSITVYRVDANGNVAPLQDISGDQTGLNDVWGAAIDASHNIYAANYQGNYDDGDLTVYAAGSRGNVSPTATIDGRTSYDPMLKPSGIGLDAAGNIYASAWTSSSISVYRPGSNGSPTPIQYVAGSYTGLLYPSALAVTANGTMYVTNWGAMSVTVYAPGSNGNVAPIQTISGSKTGIFHANAVAVDAKGRIYVSSSPAGSGTGCCVMVFDKHANGNVAPIRAINGSLTQIDNPYGIAVDSHENIYVSENSTNSITVYPKGANGNVVPTRVISGSKTMLNGPSGLIVQ